MPSSPRVHAKYIDDWSIFKEQLTVGLQLIVDGTGVGQEAFKAGHRLGDERGARSTLEEGADVDVNGLQNTLKLPTSTISMENL